uniref:Nitroreductase domain-containing protein n=1 Tax=Prymnesium polylepis TaxID=72548 RepID=A0A7S4HH22_9EUKA
MDGALAAVAALARDGAVTTAEEVAAVGRIMAGDTPFLMLAKHFGKSPSYVTHVRAALARPTAAEAVTPTDCPATLATFDPIIARRSVTAYTAADVPAEVVHRALEAAVLAPNHFLTEPWRFYLAGPEVRGKLCSLNEAKREAFEKVPGWLVVSLVPSELAADGSLSTKKGLEDHAATSAAIQNFMVSLAAAGVGSKWMTGALGVAPEKVLAAVGADASTERFMGAIWFGYPEAPLESAQAPKRKKGLEGVLTRTA